MLTQSRVVNIEKMPIAHKVIFRFNSIPFEIKWHFKMKEEIKKKYY
jgi:hypothetical protein